MPDLSGTAPPAAGPDARYTVAGFGYDDVSLGFDLSTSALSLSRVREMDGREIGASKRLGWEASWGKFENLLGRSFAMFKSDTNRLYVQWKPADAGELLRPAQFEERFHDLERRLAVVGIETFERVWVTRLDVSVDLACAPEDGKALLDGLQAARLPRGQRITIDGLLPSASVRRCSRARVLPQSEDEDGSTLREDSARGCAPVQAEGMVGGLLLHRRRCGGDHLGTAIREGTGRRSCHAAESGGTGADAYAAGSVGRDEGGTVRAHVGVPRC
jgi:hypothetical protein